MKFTLIFGLALTILTLIFALQNTDQVSLTFFTTQFSGSIAAVTVTTLIVGIVSGFLLLLPKIFESTVITRKLTKANGIFQKKDQGDLYENLSSEEDEEEDPGDEGDATGDKSKK
jgi:uncharacterized integral membrane protein